MSDAPGRIWLDWPAANRGEPVFDEPPENARQAAQTCYIRADLAAADAARIAELERQLDAANDRANRARLTEERKWRSQLAEARNKALEDAAQVAWNRGSLDVSTNILKLKETP